jgi:hypothetical protein
MNKSMLYAGLITILFPSAQAAGTQTVTQGTVTTTQTAPSPAAQGVVITPSTTTPAAKQTTVITPPATVTPQPTTPLVKTTVTIEQVNATKMDCSYRIPAETKEVAQSVVLRWAGNAATQSFDFDSPTMDNQLAALKPCYTDTGWQGFSDALQKSGNLNAIKTQRLMVSSMINGPMQITAVKENQWKVSVPLQVVYQNEQQKLTQSLMVNLIIGRKISGDLGIMQMIAVPRKPLEQKATTTTVVPVTTSTQP